MQPSTEPTAARRGLVDRLALGLLIGAVAVSVGAAALLTIYLDRIGDAAASLRRVDGLASYAGRPSPVMVEGTAATNYLLMTTAADGELHSVLIAHLSASRRQLSLIALPADLLTTDGVSLSARFADDPLAAARAVESLTEARMDHQVQLSISGFGEVVDSLGGVNLDGGQLSGTRMVSALGEVSQTADRSMLTAKLLRAAFARVSVGSVLADPTRFDRVLDALAPCLTVDAELTPDVISETLVESRIHADEIFTWALPTSPQPAGAAAEPQALTLIRDGLAADDLSALQAEPSMNVYSSPEPTR